ncbi:MAG: hypothetical protein CVV33_06775, partial [Methanomicrobiales archaeon HGW-Methanomicrobiales-4]
MTGAHRGNMKTDRTYTDEKGRLKNSLTQKPKTDPAGFFDLVNDLTRSADTLCTIAAASKLNLFDLLETPHSEEEIIRSYPYPEMILPMIQIL